MIHSEWGQREKQWFLETHQIKFQQGSSQRVAEVLHSCLSWFIGRIICSSAMPSIKPRAPIKRLRTGQTATMTFCGPSWPEPQDARPPVTLPIFVLQTLCPLVSRGICHTSDNHFTSLSKDHPFWVKSTHFSGGTGKKLNNYSFAGRSLTQVEVKGWSLYEWGQECFSEPKHQSFMKATWQWTMT